MNDEERSGWVKFLLLCDAENDILDAVMRVVVQLACHECCAMLAVQVEREVEIGR